MFCGSEALSTLPLRFCEIHVGVDGTLFLQRFSFSSFLFLSLCLAVALCTFLLWSHVSLKNKELLSLIFLGKQIGKVS